jgi:predicted ATPase/DNA-binding XRE family transcriptional regulator
MDDLLSFGRWLRRRRKALELTQAQLAQQVGFAEVTLLKIEADELRPSQPMVETLATHLEIASADREAFVHFAHGDRRVAEIPLSSGMTGQIPRLLPKPQPSNLPVSLTSFVGRKQEICEVKQLLTTTRLLTLTGTGGVGKSRLALRVSTELLDEYPDGVWLAELAPLADPTLVARTVAAVVGVHEQSHQTILASLVDALRSKRLLLLLDNCEHVVDVCAHLADAILRECPRVHILAPSRESLGVYGELAWRVPSLSTPPRGPWPSDAGDPVLLLRYASARLFVERARLIDPDFVVTAPDAVALAQICQRLDGIPLAIELAAARVKVLSMEGIAVRLDDQFRLLTGGSRTSLPRQQTLRATIDWSYTLLSKPERCLLRRLTVCSGGCSPEAAEAVCADEGAGSWVMGDGLPSPAHSPSTPGTQSPIPREDVLDLVTQLVDKSLVQVEQHDGEERYRLLETIRHYARDRLAESGETDRVRDRHRDWFLQLAERAKPELVGSQQVVWLDRLEADDNLRSALDWCVQRGPAELGLRLAGALWRLFYVRDAYVEGREWLNRVLAAPGAREATTLTPDIDDWVRDVLTPPKRRPRLRVVQPAFPKESHARNRKE